ncbi:MAG: 1-deoxy-D-xylulose-5-phosphate reductoisomerase [Deltaproteobacteria bacterium RBG_16_49_23]|nr:MAG: 1-deoxy-D-xylulose-5-phosphate reductoisomerase [Deltaproteobacteria bacterium RBG_16_49_23]
MKRLAILGSTGSIGVNTLDIVRQFPERFEVIGLSAGLNTGLLKEQVRRFQPKVVSVLNREAAGELQKSLSGIEVEVLHGVEGLIRVATHPQVTQVVSAIVGAVGLIPTLSAIKTGKSIALANKESLVMAGKIVMEEVKKNGVQILPVDSEHSAIFQAILGHRKEDIHRLILTASGGPFLNHPLSKLHEVTVKDALNHPHWEMGKKITIDSASLMNKGLEVIEAHWLFDIAVEKIIVRIHPQSVVHSMVEYIDGSIIGQMGIADMRIPISYALSFPERLNLKLPSLNFAQAGPLTFSPPDPGKFPCLRLAYQSIEIGETMPAILNAANEVAVNGFLEGRIKFTDIPLLIQKVMEEHELKTARTIEDILRADQWAREKTKTIIEGRKVC